MSQGGTYFKVGGSGGAVITLEGNTGGKVSPDGTGNINVIGGSAATVVGDPGTNTLTINVTGGGLPWTNVTAALVSLSPNNGYVMDRGTLITATLPTVAPFGSVIEIVGFGAGGFIIAQNAGQQMFMVDVSTTIGVTGSLEFNEQYDSIRLVCVTANTNFVVDGSEGNFTST